MPAADKGVVYFGLLFFRVEFNLHCLFLEIDLINVAKQAKQIRIEANNGLIFPKSCQRILTPRVSVQIVIGMPFAHEKREGKNVRILAIGLVEDVLVRIEFYSLYTIAGDKHVCLIFGAENTHAHKVAADAVDLLFPLPFTTPLPVALYFELVRARVTIQGVNSEFVLKAHGKSLLFFWEINVNSLVLLFGQPLHEFLELLRLAFLDGLRNLDEHLFKGFLLHRDGILLNPDHIQIFE